LLVKHDLSGEIQNADNPLPMERSPQGAYTDAVLDRNKQEILEHFRLKHDELRKCRELFCATIESLRAKDLCTHATFWNAALHVNLAAEDLSYMVEDLAFERTDWKRRMAARHVTLIVYETAEDLQSLLGKTLRDSLDNLNVLQQFETNLAEARRPLQVFWSKYQKELKEIRITAAAHRDLDGIVFVETIRKIEIESILAIGFQLNDILLDTGRALKAILEETSRIEDPKHAASNEAVRSIHQLAETILRGYPDFDEALGEFASEVDRVTSIQKRLDESEYKPAFISFNQRLQPICAKMMNASSEFKAICESSTGTL
jgi:hypothetical protein